MSEEKDKTPWEFVAKGLPYVCRMPVPGGWLYEVDYGDDDHRYSTQFVPSPGDTVEALQARVAELEALNLKAQGLCLAKLEDCEKDDPGMYEHLRKGVLELLGMLAGKS